MFLSPLESFVLETEENTDPEYRAQLRGRFERSLDELNTATNYGPTAPQRSHILPLVQ